MKNGRFENMSERVEHREKNPPVSVRVKPRVLASIHKWLTESGDVVRTKSDICSMALDVLLSSIIHEGFEPFFDDMDAIGYLKKHGLSMGSSRAGLKAVASIHRRSERDSMQREDPNTEAAKLAEEFGCTVDWSVYPPVVTHDEFGNKIERDEDDNDEQLNVTPDGLYKPDKMKDANMMRSRDVETDPDVYRQPEPATPENSGAYDRNKNKQFIEDLKRSSLASRSFIKESELNKQEE